MAEYELSRMNDGKKSTLKYLHNTVVESVVDGKHSKVEESVIDGERGSSFKYFKKDGDKIFKVSAHQEEKGKDSFKLVIIEGEKRDEKVVKFADVIKEIKSRKELGFALKYFEKEVKMSRSSSKHSQKRSSKKSSKKASKKSSKKASKKSPKKSSRKSSRK